MIKEFGDFDIKIDYLERNAAYLLYIDKRFRLPVVESKTGFFLVGGGIEIGESPEACLYREISEEIGGVIDGVKLVCETKTYYRLMGEKRPKKSHNYFFFSDKLEMYCQNCEDLKLYWMTFKEAEIHLSLEHQRWAISYFMSQIPYLTKDSCRLDSYRFITALNNHDLNLLSLVPKADLHNHIVFGGNRKEYLSLSGINVKQICSRFHTFTGFSDWCDAQVSSKTRCRSGFLTRVEAGIISAKKDNVIRLCANFGVCAMKYFTDADDFVSTIEKLRIKHFADREFLPELCVDLQKADNPEYVEWFNSLLKTGYFYSIDLTGDESVTIEKALPFYEKAEANGLVLKAHVAEYGNPADGILKIKALNLSQVQHGNTFGNETFYIDWLRRNNIQLNLCPSSNYYLTRIDDISNHPIKQLYYGGVKVTVNSDDALIFDSSVSNEFLKLYKHGVLDAEELNQIRINALE